MEVIIKGGATHRPYKKGVQDASLDELHSRRKFVASAMREGIFTKDQMQQKDCKDERDENKRVEDYEKWKKTRTSTGRTNEGNMAEWGRINREFKKRGEEGRIHCIDDVRKAGSVKYD